MPIEIRELVIRAMVGRGAATSPGDDVDDDVPFAGGEGVDTQDIVQECVRQVLRVLHKSKER